MTFVSKILFTEVSFLSTPYATRWNSQSACFTHSGHIRRFVCILWPMSQKVMVGFRLLSYQPKELFRADPDSSRYIITPLVTPFLLPVTSQTSYVYFPPRHMHGALARSGHCDVSPWGFWMNSKSGSTAQKSCTRWFSVTGADVDDDKRRDGKRVRGAHIWSDFPVPSSPHPRIPACFLVRQRGGTRGLLVFKLYIN